MRCFIPLLLPAHAVAQAQAIEVFETNVFSQLPQFYARLIGHCQIDHPL